MKQEDFIRRIDTSLDGRRFYEGIKTNDNGTEERLWCYPSVTTKIDEVYPKDAYLIKWVREQGIGGQAIFEQAADDGTEAHIAIDRIIRGERLPTLDMNEKVKKAVQAFIDWANEFKPVILATEEMLVNHEYGFAGTRDLRCKLDYKNGKEEYKGVYVIDYKTGNSVQEKHKIQNSAYWACGDEHDKTAILHLGNTTKKCYSFIEYDAEEYWKQFKHFNKTFEMLNGTPEPKLKHYPEVFEIKLEVQFNPNS